MKNNCKDTELRALFSVLDGETKVRLKLLALLKPDHFGIPSHQEIFKRISVLTSKGKDLPNSALFLEDYTLSKEVKAYWQGCLSRQSKLVFTESYIEPTLEQLNLYRKVRMVRDATTSIVDSLSEEEGKFKKNIDEVIQEYSEKLLNFNLDTNIHVSHQKNNKGNIERILSNNLRIIPTGFSEFDKRNGGFVRGGLIVLSAAPASGKSAMALQMAINQYLQGFNVLFFSFEMSEDECWSRLMSNYSNTKFETIFLNKLDAKQKKKQMDKMREFKEKSEGNYIKFVCDCDLKFSECLHLAKIHKPDIVYIDYISLLNPENAKLPQFQQLQEISRLAKLGASKLGAPIVLLSQLSDDDKIRYSRAINENANLTIIWRLDEEAQKSGKITFNIYKARNQQKFPFAVPYDFSYMRIADDIHTTVTKKVEPEKKPFKSKMEYIDVV